ncbi:MAG: hypothetical protein R3B81_02075 [bacterium]
MKAMRLAAWTAVLGLAVAQTSEATILIFGQDRRVQASTFVADGVDFDDDQATEVAPDTGPFDVQLDKASLIPTGAATVMANQDSEILGDTIRASGRVEAFSEANGENTVAYAFGGSNIALRFSIEHDTAYTLQGSVTGALNATATVALSRPFQTVAFFNGQNGYLEIDQQGVLEAGTYDLNVTCGASANTGPGESLAQAEVDYDVLLVFAQSTDAPVVASTRFAASPNPFRASTRLTLPGDLDEVRVFDAAGRLVRTLSGEGEVVFDGRDSAGRPLASGVYWAQPRGEGAPEPLRLVHLR